MADPLFQKGTLDSGSQPAMSIKKADAHYQFNPRGAFPFFPRLVDECPARSEPVYGENLQAEWIVGSVAPIKEACERFPFRACLVDLTVIQDARLAGSDGPYLANHVVCYRETTDQRVLRAYDAALNVMQHDPIVPHPRFYDYLYARTDINPQTVAPEVAHTTGQSAVRRRSLWKAAAEDPPDNIPSELGRLRTAFRDHLGDAAAPFERAFLVAIPFFRAPYFPLMRGSREGGVRRAEFLPQSQPEAPSPGGGVFLLLEATHSLTDPDNELEKLAASIQYLLTLATLTESSNHLTTQLALNALLSNMIHGTVTAIRAVSSDNLTCALSDHPSLESLRFEIRDKHSGERDTRAERELLDAARLVRLGEDTAAAMLSLAEMAMARGVVLRKYRNRRAKLVWDLVAECIDLVNGQARQPLGDMKPVVLRSAPCAPEWTLPEGYLDSQIVRGLLLEIAKNCSRHGQPSRDGFIAVEVEFSRSPGNELVVSLKCPVTDTGEHWVTEEDTQIVVRKAGRHRNSFLIRLSHFCRLCPGLGISSSVERIETFSYYVTRLTLGALNVQNTSGEFHVVRPYVPSGAEKP